MARAARDARIETRPARLKLAPRREPYFRTLQEGRAVGYRRLPGGKGGAWIARTYDRARGRRYKALGAADDLLDADGDATLSWAQAQDAARTWFPQAYLDPRAASERANKEPVTIRTAIGHYLDDYRSRGGKAEAALLATVQAHVLPALGDVRLESLDAGTIKSWHAELAKAPPRRRSPFGAAPPSSERAGGATPDQARARRATANRVLTVLKAALNLAYREGEASSDDAWRRVKPFQRVDAARVRFLNDDEARRLANTCSPDLRRIVTAALLTGLRYGELTALLAGDLDLTAGTLHVPVSKGGGSRHVHLTAEGGRFFEPLVAGRARGDRVLVRDDGVQWGKSQQHRPLQEACGRAQITPAISFHVLRHTYASRLARAGVPMLAIAAQLGHADTRMTARHYAHLAPDHVAAAVRAGFTDMTLDADSAASSTVRLRHRTSA